MLMESRKVSERSGGGSGADFVAAFLLGGAAFGTVAYIFDPVQRCKLESWTTTAKYLIYDVPVLLSLKSMKKVLETIFTSIPADFAEFIMWMAEICRKDDGAQGLSEEEKERLGNKKEVLKCKKLGCQIKQTLTHKDSLSFADTVCCQGAGILLGKLDFSDKFCTFAAERRVTS